MRGVNRVVWPDRERLGRLLRDQLAAATGDIKPFDGWPGSVDGLAAVIEASVATGRDRPRLGRVLGIERVRGAGFFVRPGGSAGRGVGATGNGVLLGTVPADHRRIGGGGDVQLLSWSDGDAGEVVDRGADRADHPGFVDHAQVLVAGVLWPEIVDQIKTLAGERQLPRRGYPCLGGRPAVPGVPGWLVADHGAQRAVGIDPPHAVGFPVRLGEVHDAGWAHRHVHNGRQVRRDRGEAIGRLMPDAIAIAGEDRERAGLVDLEDAAAFHQVHRSGGVHGDAAARV